MCGGLVKCVLQHSEVSLRERPYWVWQVHDVGCKQDQDQVSGLLRLVGMQA